MFLLKSQLKKDPIKSYGLNTIIRKYLFIPNWMPLLAYMEHGWSPLDVPSYTDINAKRYPIMLVFNKRRYNAYKNTKHNFMKILILGMPFVLYRKNKKISKKKDAKGTIAFPGHRTKLMNVEYDINNFCKELKALSPEFQPVTVCLHSEDLQQKEIYNNLGFEVVTAGLQVDPGFVDNFYDILSGHNYSVSNSVGSHTFYSIDLNIPFFILGEEPTIINPLRRDPNAPEISKPTDYKSGREAYNLFNTGPVTYISKEQKEYVDRETGIKDASNRMILVLYYWFYFFIGIFTGLIKKVVRKLYSIITPSPSIQ